MGHQGLLTVKLDSIFTKAFDLVTPGIALNYAKLLTYGDGTGANQADLVFHDQRTLAASTTEDLDLRGGLTDAYGTTLQFVRVKGFIVYAAVANTNNVLVGGAAATQFVGWVSDATDKVVVRPGGLLALFALDATGYPAAAGSTDFLRVGNSGAGTGVTYDIIILGCSA